MTTEALLARAESVLARSAALGKRFELLLAERQLQMELWSLSDAIASRLGVVSPRNGWSIDQMVSDAERWLIQGEEP